MRVTTARPHVGSVQMFYSPVLIFACIFFFLDASLLTRAFCPLCKSELAQLESIFYVDLIPEGWTTEDLSHKSSFLLYLFL